VPELSATGRDAWGAGIGAAIARQVVGSGGKVVIGDVAVKAGVKLADELGDDATFMECDIR